MENDHSVNECQDCVSHNKEESKLIKTIKTKEDIIKELMEKNSILIKKNVASDKENKQLKLAFKESMIEKQELRKELNAQSEAMNDILKQNTTLNDELKVKIHFIKLLKDNRQTVNEEEEVRECEEEEVSENSSEHVNGEQRDT